MPTPSLAALEKLLGGPRDNALLRFSLGSTYLAAGEPARAAEFLTTAVERDPNYSAAWKLLGKARSESGDVAGARAAYEAGIKVAEGRGDVQAAKEMKVFLKRLGSTAG
jgi:predicted Zn-dependent protease